MHCLPVVIMSFAHAAGGGGDSVDRSLSGGCGGGLGNTSRAVPSLLSVQILRLVKDYSPVVTMRFATDASCSVSGLGRSGCSDSENDSGDPHLDVSLCGYVVVTVFFRDRKTRDVIDGSLE